MGIKLANFDIAAPMDEHALESLECFKLAVNVVDSTQRMVCGLPHQDKYDVAGQLDRASNRVTARIASGYGRFDGAEGLQFYAQAREDLNEMFSHLTIARFHDYIGQLAFEQMYRSVRLAELSLKRHMEQVRGEPGDPFDKSRCLRTKRG